MKKYVLGIDFGTLSGRALLVDAADRTRFGVLSSEYHLYRAKLMARDQGIDPIMIPAETTRPSLRMNYYMREVAALWYYLLIGG